MTTIPAQTELYVSCRPQRPAQAFCVDPGEACLLQACGLGPDQTVPVLKSYGDDQCEPARDLNGNLIVLTATQPSVIMALPGNYKLDVSGLEADPCVYITAQCVGVADAPVLGGGVCGPFDLGPLLVCLEELKALATKSATTVTWVPGAFETETGECYPLGTRPLCDGTGGIECVYFDPQLKEYIVAKGQAGQNSPDKAGAACLFACAVKEICAADEDTILTAAQIKEALLTQGVTYADGTAVAATDAFTGFGVELLHLNDQVAKDDGTTFVTQTCDANITVAEGATPVDIEPGGSEQAGHDFENADNVQPAWVTDLTAGQVEIKAGSAIRVRGFFGRCGPEGTVQPLDPNAPEAVGPVKAVKGEG